MQTIKRKWPGYASPGDYQCMCDICGVHWRRSQLVRRRDNLLVCPDDVMGADPITLSLANAAAAKRHARVRPRDGGGYDDDTDPDVTTYTDGTHLT